MTTEERLSRLEEMHKDGDCRALCRRAYWLVLVTACLVVLRDAAPLIRALIAGV